jgi:hypothetical protein
MNEVDGELNLNVRRAPLAQGISSLPAIENRGEGVLIAFMKDAIKGCATVRPCKKGEYNSCKVFRHGNKAPRLKINLPRTRLPAHVSRTVDSGRWPFPSSPQTGLESSKLTFGPA